MRGLVLLALLLAPLGAAAQGVATLVADSLEVSGPDTLIAEGNIEAFYDGTRLSARRITYDRTSDRLTIAGPIFLQTGDGLIVTAERGALDPRLENGLLQGARLVLNRRLQLAANQIDRAEGRLNRLSGVAATSCQVCGGGPPLWEIRAARVVHDQQERQLYFEDATLRIRGLPVFWLPAMRLPDPTLKRATGFLIPQLRTSDLLGTGIKTPFFIRIGDHRDLTLTPYVSPETTTLEATYRQAFLRGDLIVRGAVSRDTLSDETRSYLFVDGGLLLGQDFQLTYGVELVSDPAYLLDYGYADADRLENTLALLRVSKSELVHARVSYFQTLRDDEDDATLPPFVANLSYDRRLDNVAGGTLRLNAGADAAWRTATDPARNRRDVTRLGGVLDWSRNWLVGPGVLATVGAGVTANWYTVAEDPAFDAEDFQIVPHVTLTLRWPLARTTRGGVQHLVEPVVALAWSEQRGGTPPNEDSTRAELDQANLLALSRFPGEDRVETGARAGIGLTWTRLTPAGGSSTLTFGRVVREADNGEFTLSSGLRGTASDWLLAGQFTLADGLHVDARTLFDDSGEITRAASLLGWTTTGLDISTAYIWQAADPVERRFQDISEWTLAATVDPHPAWTVSFDGRYDVAAGRPARAGIGVEWRNECVSVDLSVSRRYTSSTTVAPSTDYGLAVSLNGFSAGRSDGASAARCDSY